MIKNKDLNNALKIFDKRAADMVERMGNNLFYLLEFKIFELENGLIFYPFERQFIACFMVDRQIYYLFKQNGYFLLANSYKELIYSYDYKDNKIINIEFDIKDKPIIKNKFKEIIDNKLKNYEG